MSELKPLNLYGDFKTKGFPFLRFEYLKIWKKKRNVGNFLGVKILGIKFFISWNTRKEGK